MIQGEVILNVGAMTAGVAQTYLIREMVDKNSRYPLVSFLGKYGVASCVAGMALGGAATAVGIIGMSTRHLMSDSTINNALLSYGVPALVSGVLSGYTTPVRTVTATTSTEAQSFRPKRVVPKVTRPQADFATNQKKVVQTAAGKTPASGLSNQDRIRMHLL